MIIATTTRLTLRRLRPDDLPGLLAVVGDPEVMRFSDGVKDAAQTRAWLNQIVAEHYPRYGYGPYAVVERASGGLIGYCGLFPLPEQALGPDAAAEQGRTATALAERKQGVAQHSERDAAGLEVTVELGYRLARAAWGRGYATEAALAVRDHAFTTLGLARLAALIDPANTASLRVAAKLGMRFEREVMLPGYDHPDHLYVLQKHNHAQSIAEA